MLTAIGIVALAMLWPALVLVTAKLSYWEG